MNRQHSDRRTCSLVAPGIVGFWDAQRFSAAVEVLFEGGFNRWNP
jgi:hypothetical protein